MKVSRFYQNDNFIVNQQYDLSPNNHRHAVQVLRLKDAEELILFNGNAGEYTATIEINSKRKSSVIIKSFDPIDRESPLETTLVLAMIKPDKMDFAIQKAVELGVNCIQPIYTKRSVIKIKSNRLEKKMMHWRGVIIAACEQSGRTRVPELLEPLTIEQYLDSPSNDLRIAMLLGDHPRFSDLNNIDTRAVGISLVIGPEGGLTDEEENLMLTSGLIAVSFGSRTLRAETAAISGLTACQLKWGDL